MAIQNRSPRPLAIAIGVFTALFAWVSPQPAAAFCGFYVTGADSSLYANATMVVLMRDGTRTVLSMQNNYQGPPDAFALVIPVPSVLQKDQVKVLPRDIFTKIDALGAPRLVEYWETNPCQVPTQYPVAFGAPTPSAASAGSAGSAASAPVRVEARFEVGEYDVVILSADDSSSLDTWLRENQYNIPDGAQPVLAPYVAAGMKFFVAKVDVSRVTFNGNQAALSPLRFFYDTPEFSLPVRLGLLNSQGAQDLIVNILASQRYELANYPNVTIPTNIRVQNEVRNQFGLFYEALFAKTLEKNPKAVVTEYSWSASSCDPCPTPPLDQQALLTLGGDVLQSAANSPSVAGSGGSFTSPPWGVVNSFTLTRLHARYTKDSLGDDLVFRPASGISGGRGIPDTKGMLNQSVQSSPGSFSDFQGRYVILHPWEGELTCQNPQRGFWGGPSGMGTAPQTQGAMNNALAGAAPKAGDLSALLAESIPTLSVNAKTPLEPLVAPRKPSGNGASGTGASGAAGKPSTAAAGTSAAVPPTQQPTAAGAGMASGGSGAPSGTASPTNQRKSNRGCSVAADHSGSTGTLLSVVMGLVVFGARRRRVARREKR